MMPARRPEWGAGGPPVLGAMLAYASYGFSVIPILPGTKKPLGLVLPEGQWRKYQQHRATAEEIEQWVTVRPDTGVGVVCGAVSGGLVCLDIDDVEFSNWVEGIADGIAATGAWVERSGSGKLHVFVRSRERVLTSHLIGGGRKLADIRADGANGRGPSYMVVAPSVHPVTQKSYEIYAGDPERVGTVNDARRVFDTLRDMYAGSSGGQVVVQSDTGYDATDESVMGEAPEGRWEEIKSSVIANVRLSRKVKQAILNGAEAGEGLWAGAWSNSEVDHQVIRELRESGWDIDQIEQVFAWGPLGNNRYRTHKGTHGRAYIVLSLNKIDADTNRAQEASKHAEGGNFRVDHVVRIGFEEPLFELTITVKTNPPKVGMARLEIDDLMDEHRFSKAVGKALNFFPVVDRALEGRKFRKFGSLILDMAVEEAVPQSATVGGHLRATIMAFVLGETPTIEPEDFRTVTLGWRRNGQAFVRGGALLQRLQNVIQNPRPKPDDVWRTLRGMGAEEVGHRWNDGRTEAMWALPIGGRNSGAG